METFSIVKKVCTVYTKPISQKVSMVLRLHISYDPNKIDTAGSFGWTKDSFGLTKGSSGRRKVGPWHLPGGFERILWIDERAGRRACKVRLEHVLLELLYFNEKHGFSQ